MRLQLAAVQLLRRPVHDEVMHAVLRRQHSHHRVTVRVDLTLHQSVR